MDGLLEQLGVERFAMYVMDYGAPVGWRLALKHPERVTGLIVQNGNAYEEGLKEFWNPIKAYWADGSEAHRKALHVLVTPEITKFQYTDGVADVSRISPDNWVHDQALLDRPGNAEIQMDLFYDYRTNLPLYPAVQAYFRERQPPTLIVWGKNDKIFPADGAHPYKRDLPDVEFHLLDTGHFALEDKADEIVPLIRDFLGRKLARRLTSRGIAMTEQRPPLPPYNPETAAEKARKAEDAWNTRDPAAGGAGLHGGQPLAEPCRVPAGPRRRSIAFLTRKWQRELDYRLIKEMWASMTTASRCASPMSGTTTAATGSAATATRTGSSTSMG